MKRWITIVAAVVAGAVTLAHLPGCAGTRGGGGPGAAAGKVYVKPGEHDAYYAFLSGGHSGQIYVYGMPSCRHITTIPVFTPEPAVGYGVDEESKAMLGGLTWGDAHHPGMSETDGDYDGRWLFINDMPNARIARIDLSDFKTHEIYGPIPNVSAAHACPFPTPNTEYVFAASRFSIPIPYPTVRPMSEYAQAFNGVVAGIKVDPKSGHMSMGFEVLMPPFDWDLADAGKGPSNGWEFFTCYNSEEAHDSLEVKASQNEMDYIAMVDWRAAQKAVDEGKAKMIGGAPVLDPKDVKGIVYLFPVPKSPHGVDVDPSGQYVCASGKLQAEVSVYSFAKLSAAIAAGKFTDEKGGIPVLPYENVIEAKVPVGLGPLHTQFDGKGYAYTSLFLDSQIAKWKIGPPWNVVDKIDVYYSIGHLMASEGDTRHPTGDYVVALDKLSKDRYLSVGPTHPEAAQLIDIRGPKMELLYDFPTYLEPHYAQMIRAEKLKPFTVYPLDKNDKPFATKRAEDARVERKGHRVDVMMIAVRSHFSPDNIQVTQGDTVYFHVTNVEQDDDIAHGFGILFSSKNMQIEPGETKTMRWVADKAGVTPFYCSNFCSALHQEMQGYIEALPAGAHVAAVQRPDPARVAEVAALMKHP
ncbi:MAG TPA: Sec-dependent nitrous-oxide reductase [Candidatus Saccharimonadaceae bacterium]|jgi:nitrous-oxide reductase|nr:Sec-dependent nitrous-oxide reductase [Candidatus Saccharimonadaceae bacterium]